MFIFDAHLDLAMNAIEWNRDLRWDIEAIRQSEKELDDKPDRGKGTVCLPELQKGNIGLVVATQIARYVKKGSKLPGWHSPEQAYAMTQAQLAWYKTMESAGELVQITDGISLKSHIENWQKPEKNRSIGYILSLEGADSIVDLSYLEKAFEQGLRAIGPAHYGSGTYAQGTDATGGIGKKGIALLKEMEKLNIILDATHLCDESFWEALKHFKGHVWASHNNCRKFVNHNRQFSDEQIKVLIERGAVIGAAFDAWMLVSNWIRGKSTPESMRVTLDHVVDNIDHICQLAGNANHAALGSDLDGAFGIEQTPLGLNTIVDLQKIPSLLQKRGYTYTDIKKIMHQNWIDFLLKAWS
ncbi:MAG: membrane dipeptidase [Bacteroidota bacterium]